MNLQSIIDSGMNVSITVTASDLLLFAETLVQRTKAEIQKENKAIKAERMLDKKEVMELLSVCDTTLYLWNKKGYLKPIKVGTKVRYKWSDINSILNKNK